MRGLLPGLSLETVEQAGQVEMHTAQIPGEGRRRSPSQSSQFRSDEHATRMHQFLDSERSEVPPADVAKALLSDWVPGASETLTPRPVARLPEIWRTLRPCAPVLRCFRTD